MCTYSLFVFAFKKKKVEEGRKALWRELGRQLAALGKPGLSPTELRKSWSDLKKRANDYHKKKFKTGMPS